MSGCVLASAPDAAPRRALLLAGGGMRVAWQAGALMALEDAGLRFQYCNGASGGTLNLAMLLSGLSTREMALRWLQLEVKDFMSLMPLATYVEGPWPAMGDAEGLRAQVFPGLGIDFQKLQACPGLSATFNLCDFTRKTVETVAHPLLDEDLLVAAVSLPCFLPAVMKQGTTYTDSAWIKDTNLWDAVKRGMEELWLLWCIGNTPTYRDGLFHQYVHMIEMSANGALFQELDRIQELNARIASGDSPFGQRGPVRLHVIKSPQALPLDPDFFLGRITAGSLIALGLEAAQDYLRDLPPEGLAFSPELTAMTDAAPGLSFREQMSGPFALGAIEPESVAGGPALTMHASVYIADLEAFLEDPEHTGSLTGTIDFPPLGMEIPSYRGLFNLFRPTDQPDTTYMVYELGFEHEGEPCYLAGHKVVKKDSVLDLWKATTTLYAQLHRGTDTTGEVLGAGVLTLGLTDLMKLLGTLEVPNAQGAAQRLEGISKFGAFFLGELWETYGRFVK